MTYRPNPAYQAASKSQRTGEIRPDRDVAIAESLVDTTNLSHVTANFYYPAPTGAAMLPTKDLSFTGKIIAAGGETVNITLEVTNDEDLAAADWQNVTMSGYRPDDNTVGNARITATGATEEFAICFDELNFDYYRVHVEVLVGSVNTVVIKQRKKAL